MSSWSQLMADNLSQSLFIDCMSFAYETKLQNCAYEEKSSNFPCPKMELMKNIFFANSGSKSSYYLILTEL